MRRTMVAGNWKMHGTRASVAELIDGLRNLDLPSDVEIAVFPSDLFIDRVINGLEDTPISVGAQDAAIDSKQGALTGEISPSQLVDAGCELVLIGHSERRLILGESNETLNRKFAAAQASGLTPVLCIGRLWRSAKRGKRLRL
jgi:triosephosphate isomerase (TIM)